jgi:hypothetical protein
VWPDVLWKKRPKLTKIDQNWPKLSKYRPKLSLTK